MVRHPKPPSELQYTLNWFASIIERPIDQDSRMMPLSPAGLTMEQEARRYINPSPTMLPHERIEIYNQQYWWRLLSVLHENFPFLVRLFGYRAFNQIIGFPYICAYRPNNWSLGHLGDTLPKYLKETYYEKDRRLILDAALVDYAHINSFFSEQKPPVSLKEQKALTDIITSKLYLQPHVQLFRLPYNLFKFRHIMVEQPAEHFLENPFPELIKGTHHFAVFRNSQNRASWQELSKAQFQLLKLFKKGSSVEEACDWLNRQSGSFVEEALTNIHLWFQEWVMNGWFTPQPKKR